MECEDEGEKGENPVIYCRVAAQWAHDGNKMKYINEKKSAEKLYVTSLHSPFLSSYFYDMEEKNQISHGRQLGFCKWNTFDLKPSETTLNVDPLTAFLLTFVMFLPRDKSKM